MNDGSLQLLYKRNKTCQSMLEINAVADDDVDFDDNDDDDQDDQDESR